jgi:Protein of unknown function (DUF1553)/Protein of unknown function (DUF1549)/Planctomycete cytochrome C
MTSFGFAAERPVQFNRDVRPILSDKCFACHGPDAETVEGDLRLDLREVATKSDGGAIVPGKPDASELVRRIFSADEDQLMPPSAAHKPLKPVEREMLRRWIAEGAEYQTHWAYTPLQRPTVPTVVDLKGANAIDSFVGSRLLEENIEPAPEADRVTLIRRLSFDLIGLPPTPDEVDAFVNDTTDDAYEKLVDRLLDSQHYGERMAIYWLDLVRYADTVGYHGDQDVSQSPYRDYIINAFNANMPFDQFVREQLAGDLLPDATIDQQVASGYNRLNQTTEEGGSQNKEYLAIYFADRVRNVSQVFMGATLGCAQCHDHKYDPYTSRDFYSFGAIFADIEERGVYGGRGSRPPEIRVPSAKLQQQLVTLDHEIAAQKAKLAPLRESLLTSQAEWELKTRKHIDESRSVATVWIDDAQDTGGTSSGEWNFVSNQSPVHSGSKSRRQNGTDLVQHFFIDAVKNVKVVEDTQFYVWVYLDPKNPPSAIMLQLNDGSWEHRGVWGSDDISFGRKDESWAGYRRLGDRPALGEWTRLEVNAKEVGLNVGDTVGGMAFTQFGGQVFWDDAGWITSQGLPAAVAKALVIALDDRTNEQNKMIRDHYLSTAEPLVTLNRQIEESETKRKQLAETAPLTVVSKSVTPRTIRILSRGNWMDDSGEIVKPAIPVFLGKLDTGDRRATRLDLANWLCESDNVLTSRTMANRLWFLMFGRGICTSVDDFGGQGTFPSHPDLLNWLSVELVDSGWDIKHLLRTIVTSSTYRRSSKPTPQLRSSDPYNDLFARQGRFRIAAEMVRDGALSISGLLVDELGGPSVKPYQPSGYYAQLNFPRRTYVADKGEQQYRRGVYTHWQRMFLHPMLKAFDAPSREECTSSRSRSNTPLQALTLLNDPTFVEAARAFAERIEREGGETPNERIAWAYRAAVSRDPEQEIAVELRRIYDQHLAHYGTHEDEAKQLIATGNAPIAETLKPDELAAWTSVARVILNLHETITRY